MKRAIVIWLSVLLLSSCASLSRYPGVGRTRRYTFEHPQVPAAFDGFRIAFVSDTHYPSKFRRRHLRNAVRALRDLGPDLLLLGGDYQEGCEHVEELFAELARATPPCGTAAVLGNNDYERCTDDIRAAMARHGIRLLEHRNDTVWRDGDFIIVSGVRNPFDLRANGVSPTAALRDADFPIMWRMFPLRTPTWPWPDTRTADRYRCCACGHRGPAQNTAPACSADCARAAADCPSSSPTDWARRACPSGCVRRARLCSSR